MPPGSNGRVTHGDGHALALRRSLDAQWQHGSMTADALQSPRMRRDVGASPTHHVQHGHALLKNHKLLAKSPYALGLSLTLFFILGLCLLFGGPHKRTPLVQQVFSSDDPTAQPIPRPSWCSFGTLSGYWADTQGHRRHWQVLDPACALQDMLTLVAVNATTQRSQRAAASNGSQEHPGGSTGQKALALPPLDLPPRLSQAAQDGSEGSLLRGTDKQPVRHRLQQQQQQQDEGDPAGSATEQRPGGSYQPSDSEIVDVTDAKFAARTARILFISDSVDRFILTYLCDLIAGEVHLIDLDGSPLPVPNQTVPIASLTTATQPQDQAPVLLNTTGTTDSINAGTAAAGSNDTAPGDAAVDTLNTTDSSQTGQARQQHSDNDQQPGKGEEAASGSTEAGTGPVAGQGDRSAAQSDQQSHLSRSALAGTTAHSQSSIGNITVTTLRNTNQTDSPESGAASGNPSADTASAQGATKEQLTQVLRLDTGVRGGTDSTGVQPVVQLTDRDRAQSRSVAVQRRSRGSRSRPMHNRSSSSNTSAPGHNRTGQSLSQSATGVPMQQPVKDSAAVSTAGTDRALLAHGSSLSQSEQIHLSQCDHSSSDAHTDPQPSVSELVQPITTSRSLESVELASQASTSSMQPSPDSSAQTQEQGAPQPGKGRYLPTMCSNSPLQDIKLMATYIPGVHLTGPFHRGVPKGWQQQLADAKEIWHQNMTMDQAPDIVVIGSCLWDLARLSAYEPELVSGRELPRAFLDSWVANFTLLVQSVRAALPETAMLAFHTTMMPKFDPYTGIMEKQHLGRRFYISQMNAVGRMAAGLMGLEVLDYAALANRYAEGQTYLADAIHPGPVVGLEVANILLNYVHLLRQKQAEDSEWHHPSMWKDRSHMINMRVRRKRRRQTETPAPPSANESD